jgi:Domain of unknown function (DUF4160)
MIASKSWDSCHQDDCRRLKIEIHAGLSEAHGSYEILVYLDDGVVEGRFPRRALRHVLEWYERHRDQLQHNWELAQNHKLPVKVPPLE